MNLKVWFSANLHKSTAANEGDLIQSRAGMVQLPVQEYGTFVPNTCEQQAM